MKKNKGKKFTEEKEETVLRRAEGLIKKGYSSRDVSRLIGVSHQWVVNKIHEGRLPKTRYYVEPAEADEQL